MSNNKIMAQEFAKRCKSAFPMEISLEQLATLAAAFAADVRRGVWKEAIAVVVGHPVERYSSSGAHLTNALTFRDGAVRALEAAANENKEGSNHE